MRKIAMMCGVLAVCAGAALAADDPMAGLYGNTVLVVDGKGTESHTYYAADHTFTGIAPAYNYKYQGTWELTADGKLCRTFNPEPPGIKNPDCDPFTAHAVGDKWTMGDGGTGQIVEGIH